MTPKDLRRFFPASLFGDIRDAFPIPAGLSGARVFSVTTETNTYVLRIHGQDDDAWAKVIFTQQIASQHGIAPAIVHIDHVERATVSIKVSGVSLGVALSQPDTRVAVLDSLPEVLAKLHAVPTHFPFATIDPIAFARSIWDEQVQRAGFPAWAIPLGDSIGECDQLLKRDHRMVLSHCDLHPLNTLWDGRRVWFVDWERAGLAHPYIDLATFCNFLSMPDESALSMLERQEQAPLEEGHKLLFAALRTLCRIIYGAVFLRGVSALHSVHFASRKDTLTLSECFAMLSTGKLQMGQPQSGALIGAAFLKQCEMSQGVATRR